MQRRHGGRESGDTCGSTFVTDSRQCLHWSGSYSVFVYSGDVCTLTVMLEKGSRVSMKECVFVLLR